MTVQPYRDEGPVIVGGEDSFLDERFSQMGLESGPTNSTMPIPRAPLLSPYSVASPSHNSTLTPGFVNSPTSPMFFGGLSPGFLVQQAGDGSPISRNLLSYPTSGMQTPTWSSFDATSSNPGAIGQERHTPMSSFHNPNQYPRSLVRHGGRNVPDHSTGHHNVVDVNRIRKGADVRTTVSCVLDLEAFYATDEIRSCSGTYQTRSIRYITAPRAIAEELSCVGYAQRHRR